MPGAWMAGLGAGLQNAAQGFTTYQALQQQALENALRAREVQRSEDYLKTQQAAEARQRDEQTRREEREQRLAVQTALMNAPEEGLSLVGEGGNKMREIIESTGYGGQLRMPTMAVTALQGVAMAPQGPMGLNDEQTAVGPSGGGLQAILARLPQSVQPMRAMPLVPPSMKNAQANLDFRQQQFGQMSANQEAQANARRAELDLREKLGLANVGTAQNRLELDRQRAEMDRQKAELDRILTSGTSGRQDYTAAATQAINEAKAQFSDLIKYGGTPEDITAYQEFINTRTQQIMEAQRGSARPLPPFAPMPSHGPTGAPPAIAPPSGRVPTGKAGIKLPKSGLF